MNPKHTPGPWAFRQDSRNIVSTPDNHGRYVTIGQLSESLFITDPEHAANARLIAAAPELHNLARAARDYLSGIPETAAGGDDEAVKLTRDLSALLARIEGEG